MTQIVSNQDVMQERRIPDQAIDGRKHLFVGRGEADIHYKGMDGQGAAAPRHGDGAESGGPPGSTRSEAIASVGAFAQRLIRERRERDAAMGTSFFGEPGWDMLLDLFANRENGGPPVSVSSLCIAASVPQTTAQRWINTMVSSGVLVRRPDPRDGRRVWIELTPQIHQQMLTLLKSWMK